MMEISVAEYEKMLRQIEFLKKVDIDLIGQFRDSLGDVETGNVLRVA